MTFVSLPTDNPEGSVVLLTPEAGGARVVAGDVDRIPRQQVPRNDEDVVEAYVFDARLETMRIPEGVLVDSANGTVLPAPVRRLELSLHEDGEPAWTEVDALPRLDALRVERVSPCRQFDVEIVDFPPSRAMMLEPLPDGRLLLGRRDYSGLTQFTEFYAINDQGEVQSLAVLPDVAIYGGAVVGDQVWMAGDEGRVLHAPVEDLTRTSSIPSAPSGGVLRAMLARSVADRTELITLSGTGTLESFDGVGWTTLRSGTFEENDDLGLIRLEDGEILVATPFQRSVTSLKDGVQTDEPLASAGAPLSLGFIRGQPAAGFVRGEIFVRQSAGAWRELATLPLLVPVFSFGMLERGFLVGAGDSTLVEWNDELDGFCDPVPLGGGGGIYFVRQVGDLIVLAGRPVTARVPSEVLLLRQRPR